MVSVSRPTVGYSTSKVAYNSLQMLLLPALWRSCVVGYSLWYRIVLYRALIVVVVVNFTDDT